MLRYGGCADVLQKHESALHLACRKNLVSVVHALVADADCPLLDAYNAVRHDTIRRTQMLEHDACCTRSPAPALVLMSCPLHFTSLHFSARTHVQWAIESRVEALFATRSDVN